MAVLLPLPSVVRQPPDTMVGFDVSRRHACVSFGWEIRQLTSSDDIPTKIHTRHS